MDARAILKASGIEFKEFNNGLHLRVVLSQFGRAGHVDFWPTTGKFIHGDTTGKGVDDLIFYVKKLATPIDLGSKKVRYFTAEEIFDIAKSVQPLNLFKMCEKIHKEIYKK